MRVEFTVEVKTLKDIESSVKNRVGQFFGETPYRYQIGRVIRHMVTGAGDTLSWQADIEAEPY